MVKRFYPEKTLTRKRTTKLVQAGSYVAEVEIELTTDPEGWSLYLSLEDAAKLDALRKALLQEDLEAAAKLSRIYQLTPIAV